MYYQMYKDDPGNWQRVSEDRVRFVIAGSYYDVQLVIDTMKQGQTINTLFSYLKWVGECHTYPLPTD